MSNIYCYSYRPTPRRVLGPEMAGFVGREKCLKALIADVRARRGALLRARYQQLTCTSRCSLTCPHTHLHLHSWGAGSLRAQAQRTRAGAWRGAQRTRRRWRTRTRASGCSRRPRGRQLPASRASSRVRARWSRAPRTPGGRRSPPPRPWARAAMRCARRARRAVLPAVPAATARAGWAAVAARTERGHRQALHCLGEVPARARTRRSTARDYLAPSHARGCASRAARGARCALGGRPGLARAQRVPAAAALPSCEPPATIAPAAAAPCWSRALIAAAWPITIAARAVRQFHTHTDAAGKYRPVGRGSALFRLRSPRVARDKQLPRSRHRGAEPCRGARKSGRGADGTRGQSPRRTIRRGRCAAVAAVCLVFFLL